MQKVIVLPKDPVSMEELTLEEVEVFRVCLSTRLQLLELSDLKEETQLLLFVDSQTRAPVKTMKISSKRVSVFFF